MKISDIHVMESEYNRLNKVNTLIAKLKYPQKYLQLKLDDNLYDLELTEAHEDRFILEIKKEEE